MQVALLLLLALAAVGHVVLWIALVNRLHGLGIHRAWVNALTLACALALTAMFLLAALLLAPIFLGSASFVPETFNAPLWIYAAACAVYGVLAAAQRWHWRRHPERRDVLLANHTTHVDVALGAAAPLAAPGFASLLTRLPGNEALALRLHEKQLAIPRWTAGGGSIRIAHVSDLHMSGRITRSYFERVVEEVNRSDADLIALTGDLIERERCLAWVPDTLGRLRAEAGVYFVLGNHDRHVGKVSVVAALEDAGLIHLGGTWRETRVRDLPVILAGNELPWFGPAADLNCCPPRAADGTPLRILLAHSPDQFTWAQANSIDLMLAGHVHGGQICLPLLGPILAPSLHGVRYASGLFRRKNTVLHVTRGTSSLTPLRWNCPPEIAVLDLRPAGPV